jgi:hypothetical protein
MGNLGREEREKFIEEDKVSEKGSGVLRVKVKDKNVVGVWVIGIIGED